MSTDEQKIMIAIGYMRGDNTAGRSANLYAQEVDFDTDTQMFEEFAKKVGETFFPKEIRQEAERKLMALKQGPKDSVATSSLDSNSLHLRLAMILKYSQ